MAPRPFMDLGQSPCRQVPASARRRPSSASVKTLRRHRAELEAELVLEDHAVLRRLDELRPRTRAECVDAPRPCPFVGCRYHLAIEVLPTGSLTWVFPGLELEELAQTCALDVADRGGATLEAVAILRNVTRERIRQIEARALVKLERRARRGELEPMEPRPAGQENAPW